MHSINYVPDISLGYLSSNQRNIKDTIFLVSAVFASPSRAWQKAMRSLIRVNIVCNIGYMYQRTYADERPDDKSRDYRGENDTENTLDNLNHPILHTYNSIQLVIRCINVRVSDVLWLTVILFC